MEDEAWREPRTEAEWQRAADAASALLVIEALGLPGKGAAEINRGACEDVLAHARERGVVPRASALGRYMAERANVGASIDPARDLDGLPPR
ncbi:MAG: hypothetical protein M3Q49_18760 [Actinomycetota bacterium]|nr:hypothetical protein [Actinomycetota bacterium]